MVTPRVSGNNYQRKSAKSAGGYLDATGNVMCIYTRHGDTLLKEMLLTINKISKGI